MPEPIDIANLYDSYYYKHCCGKNYERTAEWLDFFANIAQQITRQISPKTALDAGCAWGFLVEALRDRGVDAFGLDVSNYAIQMVHEGVKPYCQLGSILEPLPFKYDLIVCIEVLEHLQPAQCRNVIRLSLIYAKLLMIFCFLQPLMIIENLLMLMSNPRSTGPNALR